VAQDGGFNYMHALELHDDDWSKHTRQNCSDDTENEISLCWLFCGAKCLKIRP